jgi:hypothetical protein
MHHCYVIIFDHKPKYQREGMTADIGKRSGGVAIIFGVKIQGFMD